MVFVKAKNNLFPPWNIYLSTAKLAPYNYISPQNSDKKGNKTDILPESAFSAQAMSYM